MGQIENSVCVYERLRKKKYRITIEDGTEFVLTCEKEHYHHLAGFHYLTDLVGIANPAYGKKRFYQQLKNHKLNEDVLVKSELYGLIAERIASFHNIEEILSAAECKIIVEFDRHKADSEIEAKYFLYKREGNPLQGEPVTYYALFIGFESDAEIYYPATYVIEHSKKYVSDQIMLNCKIEQIG